MSADILDKIQLYDCGSKNPFHHLTFSLSSLLNSKIHAKFLGKINIAEK